MFGLAHALASRPLLIHAAWGASSGAAVYGASMWATGEEPPEDVTDLAAEVFAAGAVGALQGAAMRFWYPWVERRAQRLVGKVALDAAPSALSTLGVHAIAQASYMLEHGHLPERASLLRVRRRAVYAELEEEARQATSVAGPEEDMTLREQELNEEILTMDAILDSQPSLANAMTASLSLLNFALVPRQLRAVFGTTQWQLYELAVDILQEAEGVTS